MAHCDGGYTTNVPVADLVGGKGMIATRYDGAADFASAWWSSPAACTASLLLEKRQMGAEIAFYGKG